MIAKKIAKSEVGGRGRPRGFELEEAIAIAQTLFHQKGYDGVGVAELSKAIGITAPSLYGAFGSKRGLFEQVLAQYVQQQGGWLPQALAARADGVGVIAHLLQRAAEVYTTDLEATDLETSDLEASDLETSGEGLLRGCLVMDGTRNCGDAGACELAAGYRRRTRELIRDRLAPEFPEQAEGLADYVMVLLMGMSAAARDGMGEAELGAIAKIAATSLDKRLKRQP